eukprot:487409-Amphidinium_carterae.1
MRERLVKKDRGPHAPKNSRSHQLKVVKDDVAEAEVGTPLRARFQDPVPAQHAPCSLGRLMLALADSELWALMAENIK